MSLVQHYELPDIKSGKKRWDIKGGIQMLANVRYIGTSREVLGLERWPQKGTLVPRRWLPARLRNDSKWTFVMDRVGMVVVLVVILRLLPNLPLLSSDLHPRKTTFFRRLSDVSLREIWLRCLMPPYFVARNWAVYNFAHQSCAALAVAFGWSEPHEWPRLFGNLSDAYSLRRFWSKFWHRLVYRTHGDLARIFLARVPGLRKGSTVYWTVMSLLVFFISGLAHAAVIVALGYRCGYWAEVHFFFLQFLGVVIEETAHHVMRGCRLSNRWPGYLWVFLFLAWSLPKRQFIQMKWNCRPP